nr:beta-ketoacyl synthase N-terminal-like domain-containing protein [Ruminiclostridium josui]
MGVFVGSRISNYGNRIEKPTKDTVVAVGQNFIAAHVSHFMNLKGPSMVVDTACSSSLVSIYLACQSLLSGETDMCIAGGVDILLDERVFISLSQAGAFLPMENAIHLTRMQMVLFWERAAEQYCLNPLRKPLLTEIGFMPLLMQRR